MHRKPSRINLPRVLTTTAIMAVVLYTGICSEWIGGLTTMVAAPALYLTWFAE